MDKTELKRRTRAYGLDVVRLVESLPQTRAADVQGRQLLRSGTSVEANYRAAYRARSKAEFVAKMGICEEEADESIYWLEMLKDFGFAGDETIDRLATESDKLVSIVVASIKTARERLQ